jgi:hypothetical protein
VNLDAVRRCDAEGAVKVRAMIKPNKVSEIRSTGSSTRSKGIPETFDIEKSIRWL